MVDGDVKRPRSLINSTTFTRRKLSLTPALIWSRRCDL